MQDTFQPITPQLGAIRRNALDTTVKARALPLLDLLLTMCARAGSLSIRPSNEQVIAIFAECGIEVCRRTVQRWFFDLQEAGIGVRAGKKAQGCDRPSDKRKDSRLPSLPNRRAVWTFVAIPVEQDDFFVCHPVTLSSIDMILVQEKLFYQQQATSDCDNSDEPPPDDWVFDPNAYPEADARSAAPTSARPRSPRQYTPVHDISDEDAMAWADAVLAGAIPPPVDIYPERVGEYGFGERWVQFERAVAEFEAKHGHPYDDLFDGPLLPSDTAARVGHKPIARRRRTDDTSQVALEEKQAFAKTHTTPSHRFRLLRGRVDEVVYESVNTS